MDPWPPGTLVEEFVIEGPLGEGGMGAVYAARHRSTGAQRAIKRLVGWDAELRLRFTREAQAQAAVDAHPNVLRIHSVGELDGQPYLVMALATGGNLEERLHRSGPLGLCEGAALVAQLARGLEHVHAQGVLHRDIKPANVLFDEHGTPKLVDFGIARIAGERSLTTTGSIMGSPSYMAPEQAQGLKESDARTDVYGLGGLLYATLTGRPPFSGGTVVNVLRQVLTTQPVPPTRVRPGLHADADLVCLRALAKAPAKRYPTAAAFAEDLEQLAAGKRLSRRFPTLLVVASAALLLVATLSWPSDGESPPPTSKEPTEAPSKPVEPARADRTAPELTLTRPEEGDAVGAFLVVAGTVQDDSQTVTIRVGAESQTVPAGQAFRLTFRLPKGETNARITCVDARGNRAEPQVVEVRRPPSQPNGLRPSIPADEVLVVPKGARLVVPAGTSIQFSPKGGLRVEGELWVLGEPDNPVVFGGIGEDGRWKGITVQGENASVVLLDVQLLGGGRVEPVPAEEGTGERPARYGLDVLDGAMAFVADSRISGWTHTPEVKGGAIHMRMPLLETTRTIRPSRLIAVGVQIVRNSALSGGALRVDHHALARLRECTVAGNSAIRGGAIYMNAIRGDGGRIECLRSTFENNTSSGSGGAIAIHRAATGRFEDVTFARNACQRSGGAIHMNFDGPLESGERIEFLRTRFEGNAAGRFGGALNLNRRVSVSFTDCAFIRNRTQEEYGAGGAINASGRGQAAPRIELESCTFEGNSAVTGSDVRFPPNVKYDPEQLEAHGLIGQRAELGE